MADFVHLHVHTEYSLLDGLNRNSKLVAKVKEDGMDAVAITDHGVLYGVPDFVKAAHGEDIKPIIGCEMYVAPTDHTLRSEVDGIRYYHLILLAQNFKGYQNLAKLVTIGQLEGFYYRPRVSRQHLAQYSEGLICTTACLAGPLARHITRDEMERAEDWLKFLKATYPERFYLEVERNGFGGEDKFKEEYINKYDPEYLSLIKAQIKVNSRLRDLGEKHNLPLVATADAHYLNKDDREIQAILFAIKDGLTLDDPSHRAGYLDTYVKTQEEMKADFADDLSPVQNTVKIAEQIEDFDLKFKNVQPIFWNIPAGKTAQEQLKEEVYKRVHDKYQDFDTNKELQERIEYELMVIHTKGYDDYFLIVGDLMQFAREKGIIINVRGSAAGSVIAYILDITNVEPIRWNLVFERFLNLERDSPPDIDMDLQDDRREEVIQYAEEKYGKDHVAAIGALGKLQTKAAIRDVARAMNIDIKIADKLSKMVITLFGKNYNIDKMMETDPEFAAIVNSDAKLQELANNVKKIEGLARHFSTHACGHLITPEPITNYCAMQKDSQGSERPVTQMDGNWVDKLHLMKFDFLGLRNLTIIRNAFDMVEKNHGVVLNTKTIPEDDKKTYQLLTRGETVGVFQLESPPMQKYLKALKPETLEDISFMLAAYRPGPMQFIPGYIDCKHGRKKAEYLIPELEPILNVTFGYPIYQEQLLQICMKLGGFTLGEGDVIRNALKKKQLPILEAKSVDFKKYFLENYPQYKEDKAEQVWAQLRPFADYGFNKAHSASYAMVSYWSAYLKANYPLEFMAALMHSDLTDSERIVIDIKEAQRMGYKVLPPDINKSEVNFSPEEGNVIRYGLGGIKNVGTKICEAIVAARTEKGLFESLDDLIEKVGAGHLSKKSMECLIMAGALDQFGERNALLAVLPSIFDRVAKEGSISSLGQIDLFSVGTDDTGKAHKNLTPLPKLPHVPEMQKIQWEKELLGLFLTTHPLEEFAWISFVSEFVTLDELSSIREGSKIKVLAIVESSKKITTKKDSKPMSFLTLSDLEATCEAVMFPKIHAEFYPQLKEATPIIIDGTVNYRDEKYTILIDKISEATGIKKPTRISIDIRNVKDPEQLAELSAYLDKEEGEMLVDVTYGNNGTPKKMTRFLQVSSESMRAIKKYMK